MKHYVFGYGSLINPISLGRTLGRVVDTTELQPACLQGYQRLWSLVETVYSVDLAKPVRAVFLDICPNPPSQCNGIIVNITDVEFTALSLRERNYDCIDITDKLSAPPTDGRVTVFAGRSEHRVNSAALECYVMQRYVDLLHTGVDQIGTDFANQFWADTKLHDFPMLNGAYSFV